MTDAETKQIQDAKKAAGTEPPGGGTQLLDVKKAPVLLSTAFQRVEQMATALVEVARRSALV
jgi:hypothetical protein